MITIATESGNFLVETPIWTASRKASQNKTIKDDVMKIRGNKSVVGSLDVATGIDFKRPGIRPRS